MVRMYKEVQLWKQITHQSFGVFTLGVKCEMLTLYTLQNCHHKKTQPNKKPGGSLKQISESPRDDCGFP